MATLHVLKVFVSEGGIGGNPLGVFLEGREVPEPLRQAVAADLGFSETVFVDNPDGGEPTSPPPLFSRRPGTFSADEKPPRLLARARKIPAPLFLLVGVE